MYSSRPNRALKLALCGVLLAGSALRADPAHPTAGIPIDTAEVSSSDGHSFVVSWEAPGVRSMRVFAGTDPAHIGRDHPVGHDGASGQVTVSTLPAAPRWFFALVPDRGDPLVLADRSLHLTTAANFRDAGGYRTSDGKWVRMGLVYRSNGLEHLTDDELTQVENLNLKLVCDLRTAEEVHRGPDRVPRGAAGVSADVLADDADLIHTMMTGNAPKPAEGAAPNSRHEMEQRIYRDFVRIASAQKAYESLFERLADPAQLPTVFHCTAGKDRTGWAQAVFLTILGVPRETILRDYLLTNDYLTGAAAQSVRQSMSGPAGAQPAALRADPAALDAAFDQVAKNYGSFDGYLRQGLHLSDATLAALRANFLAD